MAKVTITIEDTFDGKVKVISNPNFETMAKMDLSGDNLTAAHGYALLALNEIRKESKKREPTLIKIPGLGRA
jgi:hypothetical protein